MDDEIISRFWLQVDTNRCDACGLCIEACLDDALELIDKIPVPIRECRACGACEVLCPNGALALEFTIA